MKIRHHHILTRPKIYAAAAGLSLAVFILATLPPLVVRQAQLRQASAAVLQRGAHAQELQTVAEQLQQQLLLHAAEKPRLPLSAPVALGPGELHQLPERFQASAASHELQLQQLRPILQQRQPGAKTLLFELVLSGATPQFPLMLRRLAALEFVVAIDAVRIDAQSVPAIMTVTCLVDVEPAAHRHRAEQQL